MNTEAAEIGPDFPREILRPVPQLLPVRHRRRAAVRGAQRSAVQRTGQMEPQAMPEPRMRSSMARPDAARRGYRDGLRDLFHPYGPPRIRRHRLRLERARARPRYLVRTSSLCSPRNAYGSFRAPTRPGSGADSACPRSSGVHPLGCTPSNRRLPLRMRPLKP